MSASAFETVSVDAPEVTCDGGGGALGHPKVYLHIDHDKGDSITCPYCSRMFVLKHSQHSAA
jgi:uncharacterized Zn-finger protein